MSFLLIGGALLASLLRMLVWLFTYFLVGPVFGVLDVFVWDRFEPLFRPLVVFEVVAGAALVVAAVAVRDLENRHGRPYTREVRLLGVVFLADTIWYVVPIVGMMSSWSSGLTGVEWGVVTGLFLGNLGLGAMSVAILVRCARRPGWSQRSDTDGPTGDTEPSEPSPATTDA